ncbi:MAG: inositol monophosphatase family protein [Actinomycetota bacterium]|nr:inositol monophosphatase family protein [Actinomycetota bacterium]
MARTGPDEFAAAEGAAIDVGNAVAAFRDELGPDVAANRARSQEQADRLAHEMLVGLLEARHPGVPVVSEEDASHDVKRPETYWLIDPIDGTASWSGGHAGFVCQLALITSGVVEFAAIHAPVLGMTWTARRGAGAFLNGDRLPDRAPAIDPVVVVDNYPEPRGVCERVMHWLGTDSYVESGSIGLKAALVASGRADLFVKDVVVRDWDVAPAMAVTLEVGAFMSLPGGASYELAGDYEKLDGVVFAADTALGRRVATWMATT